MTLETLHCIVFILAGCCFFSSGFMFAAIILGRGRE